jgi:glucose/arabinose dehydrogenase/mono/diheme cytochrome c family protein
MRHLRFVTRFALLVSPLIVLAQNGDRAGETQTSLPAHWKVPPAPTLSPDEALTTLTAAPGYRVELAAADPLVGDPVAMTFGPDGRMWIVEMRGYMPNPDGIGEDAPVGAIAVLEDTNGDGRADKRTVFADGLVMPRALALVGDGLLVAEPPNLWFLRDTDGDGRADQKTLVAADYGNNKNPEHTANGLMWALDNWIYNANHTQRFRYLGDGKFQTEHTISRGQWGMTQDDTGRLFYNSNSDPLRADLVPAAYFRRNPWLLQPAGATHRIVPANIPVWPGRITTGVNRGYRILTDEGKINIVTAACGPVIYRGGLFPADAHGNAFVAEPAGNLVKRIVLSEENGVVTGTNAYLDTEFLVSTDERFRPVNLYNGPEGALYVVDMYRGIIQHRIYMTSFLRAQVEDRGLAEGIGMGRIYRVVPEHAGRSPWKFNLAKETSAQLVNRLRAANSWWRDTAQRLLVERRDPAAAPLLRALASDQTASPLARIHALWTLDGSEQLDRASVIAGLQASDARVVATATRLSEKWLAEDNDAELLRLVTTAPSTDAPALTLQRALSLGASPAPAALEAMAALANSAGDQPFIADALVSGLAGREYEFIELVTAPGSSERAAQAITLATSSVLKSADQPRITQLINLLDRHDTHPAWTTRALLRGIERYLPKTPEGKPVAGSLPVAPRGLITLATDQQSPAGKLAARLVDLLKWPGKPGLEDEAAAIAARLTPEQKVFFEKGREQFNALCAVCHQPSGEGMPGLAPQLLHSRYVLGPDHIGARIVLSGKEKNGMVMPPLPSLDDASIAAVLTYIRQAWGHNASPVSVETVAEVRREIGSREEPWTDDELGALMRTP